MNEKRRFKCKMEEVPAIAGYLAQRLRADLTDFAGISDLFTEAYVVSLETKTNECNQLILSDVLTQEIKTITRQIADKVDLLRLDLNKLDLYLKMADGQMTVGADSTGIKQARAEINNGNSEGVVKQIRSLLVVVNNNLTVLQTKGLKPALVADIKKLTDDIETLGNDQNFKTTERNRHTDANSGLYNELWDLINFICETGKALYKGVNATKLNDYTLVAILKRINAEGSGSKTGSTSTTVTAGK